MSKLPGDGLSGHPGVDHCGSPPSKTLSPSAKSFVRVRITGTQACASALKLCLTLQNTIDIN